VDIRIRQARRLLHYRVPNDAENGDSLIGIGKIAGTSIMADGEKPL
jgi:hypothetical protein